MTGSEPVIASSPHNKLTSSERTDPLLFTPRPLCSHMCVSLTLHPAYPPQVLKQLEQAMISEGGDLTSVFAEIDKDGSGSVNTEELTDALTDFHLRRLRELQQAHSGMFGGTSQKDNAIRSLFNASHNMHARSVNKTQFLAIITAFCAKENIQDVDMGLKDIEHVLSWADPNCDNEITPAELTEAVNDLISTNSATPAPLPGQYDDFVAARIFARACSCLFYRKISFFKLFAEAIEMEAEDAELENQNTLEGIAVTDVVDDNQNFTPPEQNVYAQLAKAGTLTNLLSKYILDDCNDHLVSHATSGVLGHCPHSSNNTAPQTQSPNNPDDLNHPTKLLNTRALQQTILDVCCVANRTIDIFSFQDIEDATNYFALVDRPITTMFEVTDAFTFPSVVEADERRITRLKLCRRFQHAMVKNGHNLNSLFDVSNINDQQHAHKKEIEPVDPQKTEVRISTFVHEALVDAAEAIRHTILVSPIAQARAAEMTNIAERIKEKRLNELMGGGTDVNIAANLTVSKPPCPPWKDLLHLKSQLLAKLKKKSTIRVCATVGFVDAVHEAKNKGLGWLTLFTGQADCMDIDDVMDVLLAKSKPLTVYTLRTQNIENRNNRDIFSTKHYVVFVTSPEAPVILDAGVRELQVEWPKLDTKKLGDTEIKLSLEVCTGRRWVSGKVRQSANTLSLLTSAGKKSFRTVFVENINSHMKATTGRTREMGRAKKIKVTDLNPAYWYHVRFRVDYKLVEPVVDEEHYDDDFKDISAVGRGRAYGGVRCVNTEPDVPEPPETPRDMLEFKARVMPMGGKGNSQSSVKVILKISWVGREDNGYQIKYYILQRRLGKNSNDVIKKAKTLQRLNIKSSISDVDSQEDDGEASVVRHGGGPGPEAIIEWLMWETCYSNKFEQFYAKPPPLGTVGMQFRLCAINHLGASPWGNVLELSGGKYEEFFASGAEGGVGNVGGEGGLDAHHLKNKHKGLVKGGGDEDGEEEEGEGEEREEVRTRRHTHTHRWPRT